MISWKYSFKRLSEEYAIAKKKKQALDNLYETGKISQATRDSFNEDINSAIIEIEKQQKSLLDKMQSKTQELQEQIKTLETLLANYEIQHVVGEIEDEMYQREINTLSTGLDATKNELDVIKQAIIQLCEPSQPVEAPAAPAAPEPIAPAIEAETIPVETVAAETIPVEAPPMETITVEPTPVENTPIETAPIEPATVEPAPVEVPVQIASAENAPVESAPVESTPVVTPTEPEVELIIEPTPEITTQEPEITQPTPEEPAVTIEAAVPEVAAEPDQPEAEIVNDITTPEVIAEATPEQPAVETETEVLEVVEEEASMEPLIEPILEPVVEPVIVEETLQPAHPLEAPSQAHPEIIVEPMEEQAQKTDEAETEETSENETE